MSQTFAEWLFSRPEVNDVVRACPMIEAAAQDAQTVPELARVLAASAASPFVVMVRERLESWDADVAGYRKAYKDDVRNIAHVAVLAGFAARRLQIARGVTDLDAYVVSRHYPSDAVELTRDIVAAYGRLMLTVAEWPDALRTGTPPTLEEAVAFAESYWVADDEAAGGGVTDL